MSKKLRIGIVSTSNYALKYFLSPYIKYLAEECEVTLISNLDHGHPDTSENIAFCEMPFVRKPSLFSDLMNLFGLCKMMRKKKFDIVYTISPKAGLLGMCAAAINKTPVRVHFFTGQVWVTRSGFWRKVLRYIDTAVGTMCTYGLIDSPSQEKFLIDELVIDSKKATVLGSGSVSGINNRRFQPNQIVGKEIRKQLGVSSNCVMLLFIGRLNADKGVRDLLNAFKLLTKKYDFIKLVFVGPDEGMRKELNSIANTNNLGGQVIFVNATDRPEDYMAACDVLCLPSYREGFGLVVIEAASVGVPSVGSNIYGLCDAVEDNVTGFLHKVGDPADIAAKLELLVINNELRASMGVNAKNRADTMFSQEVLVNEFKSFHAFLCEYTGR
jgi:glycosyltransferase involved in cell wall biosynthesis